MTTRYQVHKRRRSKMTVKIVIRTEVEVPEWREYFIASVLQPFLGNHFLGIQRSVHGRTASDTRLRLVRCERDGRICRRQITVSTVVSDDRPRIICKTCRRLRDIQSQHMGHHLRSRVESSHGICRYYYLLIFIDAIPKLEVVK